MSSYFRLVFLFLILSINIYAISDAKKQNDTFKQSLYILTALDNEFHKNYSQSAMLYEAVFKNSKKYEYLLKTISNYISANQMERAGELAYNNFNNFKKHKEELMRLYILSSVKLKHYDKALKVAKNMLNIYNNPYNYAIVGEIYYMLKSYKFAATYYESSYASKPSVKTLLPLVDILYSYLNQKQKAISYLETFYRQNGCDNQVCLKLFRFYQENQNLDGVISILTNLFDKYKSVYNKKRLQKITTLLVNYLEKKDIKKAIIFLEKNKIDDLKLLNLYEKTNNKQKALQLVRKLYKQTKDKSLLGQIAILEFELAKDKKKVMKHILANFNIATRVIKNPTYDNYYGYLLIDYDLNIKKGLRLVKRALKENPTNLAYKDSVAWGYYKNKQCKKAYKYMEDVVKEVGLNDEDVKLHWELIKECE